MASGEVAELKLLTCAKRVEELLWTYIELEFDLSVVGYCRTTWRALWDRICFKYSYKQLILRQRKHKDSYFQVITH